MKSKQTYDGYFLFGFGPPSIGIYIRRLEVAQRYYAKKAIPKSYSNVRESLLSALHKEIGCNRAHSDNSSWIEKDELSLQEGTFDVM